MPELNHYRIHMRNKKEIFIWLSDCGSNICSIFEVSIYMREYTHTSIYIYIWIYTHASTYIYIYIK